MLPKLISCKGAMLAISWEKEHKVQQYLYSCVNTVKMISFD